MPERMDWFPSAGVEGLAVAAELEVALVVALEASVGPEKLVQVPQC